MFWLLNCFGGLQLFAQLRQQPRHLFLLVAGMLPEALQALLEPKPEHSNALNPGSFLNLFLDLIQASRTVVAD